MKKRLIPLIMLLIMALTVIGCGGPATTEDATAPVELNVSAAASLTDAAKEIAVLYNQQHPDVKITYNFASSGTLQKQIEEGAPADLFISAGKKQMDALQEKGLIVDSSRKDLLGNELVLIAPEDSTLTGFEGLTDASIDKIAIGTPETVPAGKYAQEALITMGLWDSIQPQLVMAKDVRQVLTYVQTGNTAAGLVYLSDTYQADKIKIIAAAPSDSHAPIVYPMALIKSSQKQETTADFANFLSSQEAKDVFAKYQFIPLD
ncbi:MAG: molybdate ABC transporter substrate-binding protein [Syntrophomonadaceae bacterium]|nr:molybdate ABC transporter substrate-binding protein [Bacillota bacterium]NLM88144.1 molybdate ABC transporter substrate-binding protein [Syntrophomonadaceae bacterium]HAA08139.1 molybdate ABC transporter substrate-binding protein [Syntrophomonas sp.]HQA50095.1 molybdate ABC transporter substrate-binding protein [Syntrophomonadaceae bacterium]HQD91484.1 molybdate ABC transporter substrate-binding protein [Syntrophomonadaceae bacterium]